MSTHAQDLKEALEGLLAGGRDFLPGRDRIREALGLATTRGDGALATLGVFGAGVVLGAGLALLFSPRTGEENRRALGERVEELRETFGAGSKDAAGADPAAS
jgi:hypothetical protein